VATEVSGRVPLALVCKIEAIDGDVRKRFVFLIVADRIQPGAPKTDR